MPKRTGRAGCTSGAISASSYDIAHFRCILDQIGGNPAQWSLKDQWRRFYKSYFSITHARDESVKTAYYFFKKHQQLIEKASLSKFPENAGLHQNAQKENTPPLDLLTPSPISVDTPLTLNSSLSTNWAPDTDASGNIPLSRKDKSNAVMFHLP